MQKIPEQQAPEYVPVGYVARRCGVSNTTVLRWINTGYLSAFRLPGGHFRIDKNNFSDFLNKFHMPPENRPVKDR